MLRPVCLQPQRREVAGAKRTGPRQCAVGNQGASHNCRMTSIADVGDDAAAGNGEAEPLVKARQAMLFLTLKGDCHGYG